MTKAWSPMSGKAFVTHEPGCPLDKQDDLFDAQLEGPAFFEEAVDMVLRKMKVVMIDRQKKYGPNNIRSAGVHGLVVRIQDKLERLKQDHKDCPLFGDCVSRSLPDEKEEDAWIDLANYAGPIGIMVKRGWWGLPLSG